MASIFKTERVVSGVNLARGVVANQLAGHEFFSKMMGPAKVQQFARKNPKAFARIMGEMALLMGFSISTRAPLAESINPKTGILTVVGSGGEFTLPQAKKVFTKNELKAPEPLLVICPLICSIGKDRVTISSEFSKQMQRKFINFSKNMPQDEGFFEVAKGKGMPGNKSSRRSDPDAIYRYFVSDFGLLQRSNFAGRQDVDIGDGLEKRGGVLVPTGSAVDRLLAAAEEELGGNAGPATRAVFKALKELA